MEEEAAAAVEILPAAAVNGVKENINYRRSDLSVAFSSSYGKKM